MLNVGEKARVCLVVVKRGRGSYPKPQACVGETSGVKEGVGGRGGGVEWEALPTSKAASLGAPGS